MCVLSNLGNIGFARVPVATQGRINADTAMKQIGGQDALCDDGFQLPPPMMESETLGYECSA